MTDTPAPRRARQLASDTYASVCPEALAALQEVNAGHASPYGDDPWTARAAALFRELFDTDCAVFFVPTGTAANALALAALCRPYHSVYCHADAHVQTDECGAPEYAARGIKLVPVEGREGKVAPPTVRSAAARGRDIHSHKPGALTVSQATEVGTAYTVAELEALAGLARELGLWFHMDGARFANALATLRVSPKAVTWQAGVDVLSFGGTKNGLAAGDAIVFFNRELAREFEYRRKQAGHLFAKMRYVAAPWVALLESGAWLRNAE
ncbi:MAG TPA: beta-eliminating lyase-related protein, partial [Gemmataceae bacterium]|nr:beta-eliminating lyase-related protein [Gemmataceae bacterium]